MENGKPTTHILFTATPARVTCQPFSTSSYGCGIPIGSAAGA
jgi:hypothetical protein